MKTRIWNLTASFPNKVNFIDDNNVILGYDLRIPSSERAFWTIGKSPDGSEPIYRGDDSEEMEIELDGYNFDPNFCERANDEEYDEYVAIFKLVGKPQLPDLFLRLENHHNGYYSHGFTFRGAVVIEDSL
jgi:hypothetical protein